MPEKRYDSGIIMPPKTLDQVWTDTCRLMADIIDQQGSDYSVDAVQRVEAHWDGEDDMALNRFKLLRFNQRGVRRHGYAFTIVGAMAGVADSRYRLLTQESPKIDVFDSESEKFVAAQDYCNSDAEVDVLVRDIHRYLTMSALALCNQWEHQQFDEIVLGAALEEWRNVDIESDDSYAVRSELQDRHTNWRLSPWHMVGAEQRQQINIGDLDDKGDRA